MGALTPQPALPLASLGTSGGLGAPGGGVESRSIGALVIDTFDDIDLTTIGPVGSGGSPVSRPRAAALRHVANVQDFNVGAPCLLALNAHRVAAWSGGGERSGIVGTQDESVAGRVGQVEALGGSLVDIIDASVSGVGDGLVVEVAQERSTNKGIRDRVGRRVGQGGSSGCGNK